jgi:hypothetical protein
VVTPLRLGIIVARVGGWPAAIGLADAALQRGSDVRMFAMDEALAATALGPATVALSALAEAGAAIVFCATSCDTHGSNVPSGVELGSQLDHARTLQWATRVVALT